MNWHRFILTHEHGLESGLFRVQHPLLITDNSNYAINLSLATWDNRGKHVFDTSEYANNQLRGNVLRCQTDGVTSSLATEEYQTTVSLSLSLFLKSTIIMQTQIYIAIRPGTRADRLVMDKITIITVPESSRSYNFTPILRQQ